MCPIDYFGNECVIVVGAAIAMDPKACAKTRKRFSQRDHRNDGQRQNAAHADIENPLLTLVFQ